MLERIRASLDEPYMELALAAGATVMTLEMAMLGTAAVRHDEAGHYCPTQVEIVRSQNPARLDFWTTGMAALTCDVAAGVLQSASHVSPVEPR